MMKKMWREAKIAKGWKIRMNFPVCPLILNRNNTQDQFEEKELDWTRNFSRTVCLMFDEGNILVEMSCDRIRFVNISISEHLNYFSVQQNIFQNSGC